MIKTITKFGNSQGIIFDDDLLELANLKVGDKVTVTVHEGGTITLVPDVVTAADDTFQETLNKVLKSHSETLKKLS